jgi:hypothetical protein
VLEFLDKNMSKEEWAFVHDISGTFQELFPLKQEMLRELGSHGAQGSARIAFQTPHGEQPGWYWPITYDPARSHSVKERNAKHEAALFEDNIFTRADTSTGREQTRNDNYAKPMLLSIDVLPRVLKDEIRDITTRRPSSRPTGSCATRTCAAPSRTCSRPSTTTSSTAGCCRWPTTRR